jgi:hypothetical protein
MVSSYGTWSVNCGYADPPWPQGTNFTVYIDGCCGHSGWSGFVNGTVSGLENNMGNIVVYPNKPPNQPLTPTGKQGVHVDEVAFYYTKAHDPNFLNKIKYRFNWDSEGVGDVSNFTPYEQSGVFVYKSHSWEEPGVYVVKAQAWDEYGAESEWSEGLVVTVTGDNTPPEKPVITGPTIGNPDEILNFEVFGEDFENDNLSFLIDWGNNDSSDWIGPFSSGTNINIENSWDESGIYSIRVKSKDTYDSESQWSELLILTIGIAEIEIIDVIGGLNNVEIIIKNIGLLSAYNITYDIIFEGGLILLGRQSTGNLSILNVNEENAIYSNNLFGLGKSIIKIEINCIDAIQVLKEMSCLIFLNYILILN